MKKLMMPMVAALMVSTANAEYTQAEKDEAWALHQYCVTQGEMGKTFYSWKLSHVKVMDGLILLGDFMKEAGMNEAQQKVTRSLFLKSYQQDYTSNPEGALETWKQYVYEGCLLSNL